MKRPLWTVVSNTICAHRGISRDHYHLFIEEYKQEGSPPLGEKNNKQAYTIILGQALPNQPHNDSPLEKQQKDA